ncbi:P1 family peptidase [Labrys monachus]|uniref:L-aminopeptidase/D-esterase-like protein n=1 Tax=Labrys monachus TaxID=217067 RepID=A0ABU0FIU1_9HYPH|nr:P1 family peptidase [Labrys monachus]MDQ0394019.1 L-aminopeptidase/D-esterase-like protein [Labrys monachus]
MQNLITDVEGIAVGNARDLALGSGTTAILFDEPTIAAVDVRGGAPGTRETDLLGLERTVERVDAIVLSGGSAFGLEAAGGVMAFLAQHGRGFRVGDACVPIVPGAILFDLLNGGDKAWGLHSPYRDLGLEAAGRAGPAFLLGTEGAGTGATTASLKGGLGSASARIGPFTVGALVAVNALGSVTIGDGPHFWSAPYERDAEYGGLGLPHPWPADALALRYKGVRPENTTIAVVATDARLSKAQARHFAVMAQDGLSRAIHPVHTPLDGDTVFAAATGKVGIADPVADLIGLGTTAAHVLARACARGIYEASSLPYAPALPAWRERFGHLQSA